MCLLHPCAARVDARRGLCRVAAQLSLLLEESNRGLGLDGLDSGTDSREAAPDDDHMGTFLVRGVAELAVLLSLAARGAPSHHSRTQPREEQEVCDRVLQRMACEDLQELP